MSGVARTVVCAALAGLVLAGCGDEPAPAEGRVAGAIRIVDRLEAAIQAGDYERVCDELFLPEIREQAGGRDCPALLERTAGSLQLPEVTVKTIDIGGGSARVEVVTTAEGQAAVSDTILLERGADGAFQVAGLGY